MQEKYQNTQQTFLILFCFVSCPTYVCPFDRPCVFCNMWHKSSLSQDKQTSKWMSNAFLFVKLDAFLAADNPFKARGKWQICVWNTDECPWQFLFHTRCLSHYDDYIITGSLISAELSFVCSTKLSDPFIWFHHRRLLQDLCIGRNLFHQKQKSCVQIYVRK